jgi:hypothetical protein
VLLATAPFSAVLARKIGTKSVVVPGLLLIALGLGFVSQTTVDDGYRWCLPFLLLIGCGVGLALAPSTDSVMGSVPTDEAGVGSATSDTSLQAGGALGMDLGLLIASIVVAAAACVVLLALPQRPPPSATPTQAPAQLALRT